MSLVASLEAAEALENSSWTLVALHDRLLSCDIWSGRLQSIAVAAILNAAPAFAMNIPTCDGESQPHITMCGRDSVQIHERRRSLDLASLSDRLSATGLR